MAKFITGETVDKLTIAVVKEAYIDQLSDFVTPSDVNALHYCKYSDEVEAAEE